MVQRAFCLCTAPRDQRSNVFLKVRLLGVLLRNPDFVQDPFETFFDDLPILLSPGHICQFAFGLGLTQARLYGSPANRPPN
ncbi:hypothetical protein CEXT_261881 [Caerostris extrusa]|uniref:Uncharacterized protein n=1 Tax=Caerostris extrusa TaxID=172846 RepID=A0AAV4SZT9_CAEEX|nr:hypothetical protein CEXT_261881 [Caerostris extrusa]